MKPYWMGFVPSEDYLLLNAKEVNILKALIKGYPLQEEWMFLIEKLNNF